jgi:hypothetical protein
MTGNKEARAIAAHEVKELQTELGKRMEYLMGTKLPASVKVAVVQELTCVQGVLLRAMLDLKSAE